MSVNCTAARKPSIRDIDFTMTMPVQKENICIWMNIPSHYQSAFFKALNAHDDLDLKVVYLNDVSNARVDEGWSNTHDYEPFECSAEGLNPVDKIEKLLPDWKERTHLICGYFASDLIDYFCAEGVAWCHWSEMPGIRLADMLCYRMSFFRLLNPVMLSAKWNEGIRIRKHALGAFGQGVLARKAFRSMGVPDAMISDLYYVPAPLEPLPPSNRIVEFAAGRKVFLSVGALCRRKGVDLLLKAFAELKTNDWCLVFCGLDRSGGEYKALVEKLGIDEQVLFLGAYPVERISEVYCAADVFVLASRFDGWGAVLNEAASLGLPLIGTDMCGGSWHVVDDGITGFRVRTDSVSALSRAMQVYVRDADLAVRHGSASRKRFDELFTPERNAIRMVAALKQWSNE